MSNPIRFVAARSVFSESVRNTTRLCFRGIKCALIPVAILLVGMIAVPPVGAQNVMHVPTPSDNKDNKTAPKSELAAEPSGSETPPTLRIVLALALGAAVVAVVCVPSRKGGGDER